MPREYSEIVRALLLVALTAALVAPASALAGDGQPQKALTKAGQATARSVVLKRGDATESIRTLSELWWRAVYSRPGAAAPA